MLVSVIVPVLADTAAAGRLLAQLPPDPRLEIVVVDGGGDGALEDLARGRGDVRIVRTRPGRAIQMNAGAQAARGPWLLFLHADSTLPPGWLDLFERAVTPVDGEDGVAAPPVRGGWFQFALDHPSWQARAIEMGVRLRIRLWRLPYGDQGVFASRAVFDALGGYREMPLMEDVDFVRRLAVRGPVIELPLKLRTSARRWERDGWFRRSVGNMVLVTLYFLGVSPARLARWYRRR
jgi:rSAM/selenodomain-associated transferase 2